MTESQSISVIATDTKGKEATVICPICGEKDRIAVLWPSEVPDVQNVSFSYTFAPEHTKTFQVNRCLSCTHRFCAPLPDDIYEYYTDVVDEEYLRHEDSRRSSARLVVREMIKAGFSSGKWLDVGCATGDLLVETRNRGFEAVGLELSRWSSEIASSRGLRVLRMRLDELNRTTQERFDVISLIGVIEHFQKPIEELKEIISLLKPGGALVTWTGDVDSITSKVLGRKWWYWQGQHVQYFTKTSITHAFNHVGFKEICHRTYPFCFTEQTLSNSVSRYRSGKFIRIIFKPVFNVIPSFSFRIPGEMLTIARK